MSLELATNLAAGGRQGGTIHLVSWGQEDSGHWAGSSTRTRETWQVASSELAREPITCCFSCSRGGSCSTDHMPILRGAVCGAVGPQETHLPLFPSAEWLSQ